MPGLGHHALIDELPDEAIDAFAAAPGPRPARRCCWPSCASSAARSAAPAPGAGALAKLDAGFVMFRRSACRWRPARRTRSTPISIGSTTRCARGRRRRLPQLRRSPCDVDAILPAEICARLREVKDRWDPDGVIRANHMPASGAEAERVADRRDASAAAGRGAASQRMSPSPRTASASIPSSSIRRQASGSSCAAARVAANSRRRSSAVASARRLPSARPAASSRSIATVVRASARSTSGCSETRRHRLAEHVVGGLALGEAPTAPRSARGHGPVAARERQLASPSIASSGARRRAPRAARAWTETAGRRCRRPRPRPRRSPASARRGRRARTPRRRRAAASRACPRRRAPTSTLARRVAVSFGGTGMLIPLL